MAGAHKKSECVQHTEIYLLGLKVQYKHKTKLPLDMASKHVLLSVQLPDYMPKLYLYINMMIKKNLEIIDLFLFFQILIRFMKLMYNRIVSFMEMNNTLFPMQYGSFDKHSTQHALSDLVQFKTIWITSYFLVVFL